MKSFLRSRVSFSCINKQYTRYFTNNLTPVNNGSKSDSETESKPQSISAIHETLALQYLNKPKLLSVAFVGQPNVGKSTLFNRLTQHNRAIVTPIPGTTRDRRDGSGYFAGLDLNIIDTGGYDNRGIVTKDIKDQIQRALIQSDVVVYLVDGKFGVNVVDMEFSKWLRKTLGIIENLYPKSHGRKREVILVNSLSLFLSICFDFVLI